MNKGDMVNFNFEAFSKHRGNIDVLKNWYGNHKRKIVDIFTNCKGEELYQVEGIAGGFSMKEIVKC